ncbi:hypothetical protein MRX96_011258 [Rhipicephalus microplus]
MALNKEAAAAPNRQSVSAAARRWALVATSGGVADAKVVVEGAEEVPWERVLDWRRGGLNRVPVRLAPSREAELLPRSGRPHSAGFGFLALPLPLSTQQSNTHPRETRHDHVAVGQGGGRSRNATCADNHLIVRRSCSGPVF